MTQQTQHLILDFITSRLDATALEFLQRATEEIENNVSNGRFMELFSLSSRYVPRRPLALLPTECQMAAKSSPGWNPERWNQLEMVRVALILIRPDLTELSFAEALEACFRYADEGELCALYRSFTLLPKGERFHTRATEGCRTNMTSVFEAIACDTAYPERYFDDTEWRQLVIKAIFIGAPLWRVYGLDRRLSPELARMALDYAEERSSAGRLIPPQLWLCLGTYGDDRAVDALKKEYQLANSAARQAVVLALGRAEATPQLKQLMQTETDAVLRATIKQALASRCDQTTFRNLIS